MTGTGSSEAHGRYLTMLFNLHSDRAAAYLPLSGFVEPAPGAFAGKTLIAGYKCPRTVEVREQPLPLSGANKIDKPRLRAPFWQDRASRIV